MARCVAFLRAINVGGHVVKMEVLRAAFESLGLTGVETFIASGNVIFDAERKGAAGLQGRIETCLREILGYEVATFLRMDSEVAALTAHKAFSATALATAGALNVGFLNTPLSDESVAMLMGLKSEIDDFHVHGREVYWLCKRKQSESKFNNALFEKTLKTRATFRGMNTLQRLVARYSMETRG